MRAFLPLHGYLSVFLFLFLFDHVALQFNNNGNRYNNYNRQPVQTRNFNFNNNNNNVNYYQRTQQSSNYQRNFNRQNVQQQQTYRQPVQQKRSYNQNPLYNNVVVKNFNNNQGNVQRKFIQNTVKNNNNNNNYYYKQQTTAVQTYRQPNQQQNQPQQQGNFVRTQQKFVQNQNSYSYQYNYQYQFTNYDFTALNYHNKYRSIHRAPGMNLDADLNNRARYCAQYYANKGKIDHSCNNKNGAGENLYVTDGFPSPDTAVKQAVNAWYREKRLYRDYENDYGFSRATGHFTQLVWEGSRQLGIGVAVRGGRTFVAVLYFPPGNYRGRFSANVHPPTVNA